MSLAPSQTDIISVFGEGLLYGIFWALFFIVISDHTRGNNSMSKNAMTAVAVIMFIDSTIHMAFVLVEALTRRSLTPSIAFIAPFHIFLGDAILVWRVWMILSSKKAVVLPLIALLLTLGFGIESAVEAAKEHRTSAWSLPTTILTIVNTISCTALLVWKIATSKRKIHAILGTSPKVYGRVICIMIESGTICSAGHIIALVLTEVHNQAGIVVLRMLIPLAGVLQTSLMVMVRYTSTTGYSGTSAYLTTAQSTMEFSGPATPSTNKTVEVGFHHRNSEYDSYLTPKNPFKVDDDNDCNTSLSTTSNDTDLDRQSMV